MIQIQLNKTIKDDLPFLYQFQLDEEAINLAAFTPKEPIDLPAYIEKFSRFLTDPTIHMQTIRINNVIVGSIAKYEIEGEAEITYWIDKEHWGKGIATTALQTFLTIEKMRPIQGRTAFDNFGSQKVLEKCGFIRTGSDKGYANARQAEIEEYIYLLP